MATADISKSIDIFINVMGNIDKSFADISKAIGKSIQHISKYADSASKGLNEIITPLSSLSSITPPKDFSTFAENIRSLAQVSGKLPKFSDQSLNGLDKLSKITFNEIPDKSIESLKNLLSINPSAKLPTIGKNAVESLRILGNTRFNEIPITFISGLEKLFSIGKTGKLPTITKSNVNSLIALGSATFNEIPISFVTGLERLFAIGKTGRLPVITKANIDAFQQLGRLKINKIPSSFTKGLKELSTLSKIPSLTGLAKNLNSLNNLKVPKFTNLTKQITTLSKAFDKIGKNAKIIETLSRIARGADSVSKNLDLLNNVTKQTGNTYSSFFQKIKNYASYRVVADAIIGIKNALNSGRKEIIDYDQSLKDLQAITSASALDVLKMGKAILNVATSTKFSASEVAQGMKILGQAGFSASESIQTIQAVANLATGTLSSMSESVDLITTAMRVFGIDASKSAHVADVFANAVNKSKLTVDKLRIAMNYVGPIAAKSGVSFEALNTALGLLANSGLRASTIGTGLRRVLSTLVDPNEKLTAAAKKVGISLDELNPTMNDFGTIIQKLGVVVDSTSTAFEIFGKRGASAVLSLTEQADQFDRMLALIERTGTASSQAQTQMQGLGVAIKNMQDKAGLLAVALGKDGISDAMKLVVDIARDLLDVVTELANTGFAAFIIKNGLLATGIILTLAVFRKLFVSVASLSLKFKELRKDISDYGTQIAFAKAGLTSLTVANEKAAASLVSLGVAEERIKIANRDAALSATEAAASMSFLGKSFAWLTGPIGGTIITVLGLISFNLFSSSDAADEARSSASQLFDEYERGLKDLANYTKEINDAGGSLEKTSKINIDFRNSLISVSEGNSVVSASAYAVVNSIDAVTGEIKDGGDAIDNYNKKLQSLKFTELGKQLDAASEKFDGFSSKYTTNRITDYKDRFVESFKYLGKFIISSTTGIKSLQDATSDQAKAITRMNEKIKSSGDLISRLSTISFDDLTKEVNGFSGELNDSQKAIKNFYDTLRGDTAKALKVLKDSGKIDFRDSADQVIEIAKNLGLVKDESSKSAQAMRSMFLEIQKAAGKSKDGLVGIWRSESNPILDFANGSVKGFENLQKVLKNVDKQQLANFDNLKQQLVNEQTLVKGSFASRSISAEEYVKQLADIDKRAAKLNTELYKNEDYNRARRVVNIEKGFQKQLKDLEDYHKKFGSDEVLFQRKRLQLIEENTKSIQHVMASAYDAKELLSSFKTFSEEQKKEFAKNSRNIREEEYKGVYTKEQADYLKLKSQFDTDKKIYDSAKSTFEKIKKSGYEKDSKEYVKALREQLKAEESYNDSRLNILEKFSKKVKTTEERISKNRIKEETKIEKFTNKTEQQKAKLLEKEDKLRDHLNKQIINAERTKDEKIRNINKSLAASLLSIDKKRENAHKKTVESIYGIEQDISDKIRAVRERNYTDAQKNAANEEEAQKSLYQGLRDFAEASSKQNAALLTKSKNEITKAGDLFAGLQSQDEAEKGLFGVKKALIDIAKLQETITNKKLDEDESRKKSLAETEKQVAINKANTTESELKKKSAKDISTLETDYTNTLKIETEEHQKSLDLLRKKDESLKSQLNTLKEMLKYSATGAPPASINIPPVKLATGGSPGNGGYNRPTSSLVKRGSGKRDDVKALLKKDEYVIKDSIVHKLGVGLFDWINSGFATAGDIIHMFANGGPVSPIPAIPSGIFPTANKMTSGNTNNYRSEHNISNSFYFDGTLFKPSNKAQSLSRQLIEEVQRTY